MSSKLERVMTVLIKNRIIVLGVLGGILLLSIGTGVLYQKKIDQEKEAGLIFDEAWQKVFAVVSDMQQQPNGTYALNHPNIPQAQALYKEGVMDINTLTLDYPNTIAGARAALLLAVIGKQAPLNTLLNDPDLTLAFATEDYFAIVKEKHPKFWGAAIAMTEGIQAEQTFDFAKAITFYQEALALDKANYITDYALVSIARNYETLNNKEKALEYYQQIEDDYPLSSWLSFAMGKVYLLSQES